MTRWLKRLAWLVLALVVLVVVVLIAPVGRYVGLAIEDDTFAKAERVRRAKPLPAVPVLDAPSCFEGTVTLNGAPAANVAISAGHHRQPKALCAACVEGCDCDAALEAKLALPTHEYADDDLLGTTSDAQGAFRLCGLWNDATPIHVWAEGPDDTSDVVSLRWPTTRTVRLELMAQVNLVGRVVDDDGQGLAGAKVVVVSMAGGPGVVTTSDEHGAFAAHTARGVSFVLASAPGYRPAQVKVTAGSALPVMVELKAELEAFVTVLDDAQPVPGVEVLARHSQRVALTDRLGVAHFARLGRDQLTAHTKGRIGSLTFAPPLPGPVHVVLHLVPAFVLRGVVTRDGAPVEGVEVTLRGEQARELTVKTGADGAFSTGPSAAGLVHVDLADARCEQTRQYWVEDRDLEVDVPFECDGGLQGQVVTSKGRPLEKAYVRARCGEASERAFTDRFGHFAMWPPAGTCELTVSDPRIALVRKRVTAPSREVVLVGDEGASVHGRVVDEQGRALAGTNVIIFEELLSQAVATALKDGTGFRAHTTADEHGDFELGGLSAGRYRVAASERNAIPTFSNSLVLLPAQSFYLGTLVVQQGVVLSGRVTDARGQPIVGASVRANDEQDRSEEVASITQAAAQALIGDFAGAAEHFPQRTTTDVFGRYSLDHARGVTTLTFAAENYRTQVVRVSRHEGLDVVLEGLPKVTVRGRVVDAATRRPVVDFSLEEHTFQDPNGRFSYTDTVAEGQGRVAVQVSADGYHPRSVPFERSAATEVDLGEVELQPDEHLATTVRVRASGEPVAKASVQFSVDGEFEGAEVTDSTGVAHLERPPSAGEVTVTARGYSKKVVPLGEGQTELEVSLERWSRRVDGRALGLDGKPAAGQTVTLGDATALVGDDGHFMLEHVVADANELTLATTEATWGRVIDAAATSADIGLVDGDGVLELTVPEPGPFALERGTARATEAKQVLDGTLAGTFVTAPMLPAGTWRVTMPPGQVSVFFVPFNERGLSALFHELHLAPKVVEVRRGETVRLTLE